jgi:hypothetical protein
VRVGQIGMCNLTGRTGARAGSAVIRYRVSTRDGGKSAIGQRMLSSRHQRKSICDIYVPYAGSDPYKGGRSPITNMFVVTGLVVWITTSSLGTGATKTPIG